MEQFFSTDGTGIPLGMDSLEGTSNGALVGLDSVGQYKPMGIDVDQSVQSSSEFVNIPTPAGIVSAGVTGVWTNESYTPNDDVIMISTDQMHRMGITDQQSFDLVMTHEAMQRVLQNVNAGFSLYEKELCCDYIAGVRAGLNDMDVSGMEKSLAHTEASATHPAGINRVASIEAGVAYAKDYLASHNGEPPSMSECVKDFRHHVLLDNSTLVTLRPEDEISFRGYDSILSSKGCNHELLGHPGTDDSSDYSNLSFNGYSKDEIAQKLGHAESEKRHFDGLVEHHKNMAKHGLDKADTNYHINEANSFQKKANEWESEVNKWKHTKPDK